MPHSRSTSHTSSHHETLSSPNQRTPLLHHSSSSHTQRNAYHRPSCQQEDCEHEALSPYASRPNSSSSTRPPTSRNDSNGHTPTYLGSGYQPQASDAPHLSDNSFGGKYGGESDLRHGILGDAVADGVLGDGTGGSLGQERDGANEGGEECGALAKDRWKGVVAGMSTTQYLARSHDVKGRRTMYVSRDGAKSFLECTTASHQRMVLIACSMQVSSILLSFAAMDHPIPLALPPGRPHSSPYNGIFLHSHVTLIRLQSRPYTSHQRPLLLCLQPAHLRFSRLMSPNGSRPRSRRIAACR